jgi:hypothetical protein
MTATESQAHAWQEVWEKLGNVLGYRKLNSLGDSGITCALGAIELLEYLICDPDTDLCVRYKASNLERAHGSSEYVYVDGEHLIQLLKDKVNEKKSACTPAKEEGR